MAFELKSTVSPQAILLARKLFDFLTYTVEKHFDTSRQQKLIDDWAAAFERFLQKHPPDFVVVVFDYYVQEWKKTKGYVYITPEQFIGDFTLLAQRYNWNYQPIPTKDLQIILQPLRREHWDCEWEKLVISVSQTLHNLRLYNKAIKTAEIPDNLKRQLRAIYGHIQEYTTKYYLEWRTRQIEAIWTATITKEKILGEARKCLGRFGCPKNDIRQYLQKLETNFAT